jgi:hypothetical protein
VTLMNLSRRHHLSLTHGQFAGLRALVLLLTVLPAAASAQFQWRDADGGMVYSDRPPPTSVPDNRIVRPAPGSAGRTPLVQPTSAAALSPPGATSAAAPAVAGNAVFRRRPQTVRTRRSRFRRRPASRCEAQGTRTGTCRAEAA